MRKMISVICAAVLLCTLLSGCMIIDHFNGNAGRREAIDLHIRAEVQPSSDEQTVEVERSGAVTAGQEAADALRSKVTWKVIDSEWDGCTVEFTSPNMSSIIRQAYAEFNEDHPNAAISQYDALVQELTEDITAKIAANDCPMVTTRVKVAFDEEGPIKDKAFYDAMYGGLISTVEALEEAYGGGQ